MDHDAHDRRRMWRWTALTAVGALIATSMLAVMHATVRPIAPGVERRQPADHAAEAVDVWAPLRVMGALEAEHFPSIAAMRDSADAVVTGTFVSFGTRLFHGDAAEDVLVYLVATLRVDEVLAGSLAARTVPLEFLVPSAAAQDAPVLATLATTLPRAEMMFFLRHKRGNGEAGLYRVVNSTGLWAPTSRSELDTPLAEAPPDQTGTYSDELSRVTSMDGLKRLVSTPAVGSERR